MSFAESTRSRFRTSRYGNAIADGATTGLVSIVVPTYRRADALADCLEALASQSASHRSEVIAVHDGPAGADTRRAAHAVLLVETDERRGPAAARNEGVQRARGSLVLFTDDDCVPAPDWVERMVDAVKAGHRVIAGGTSSEWSAYARATQAITDALMTPGADGGLTFAPTLNLACERRLLLDVPFDESFGDAAGEDRAWCDEVTRRGVRIAFCPEARVDHRPHLGLRSFVRQHARYGRGSRRYRVTYARQGGSSSFYESLLRQAFSKGADVGALVLLAQAATATGIAQQRLTDLRRVRGARRP